MNLTELTIQKAQKALRDKKVSARDLTQACLNKIDGFNKKLNAFLTVIPETALAQADEVDELVELGEDLPPLAGIPLAIKDNICTKGAKTTAGSKILENFIAPYDATVVEKLKEQHAVILGKTNLDEFAMGASTEYSAFGPTKNPVDVKRVPGGSSGGSAAAVKAGMCLGALGSDTGGSVRQPASFCGVVGYKPTYGAVSRYGLIALTSSLDQIGPLAKTVEDAKIIFSAIAGSDAKDATTAEIPEMSEVELSSLTIGIPEEYFAKGLDPEVEKTVKHAIKKIKSEGAGIKEISLPHTDKALPCYYIINPSEASSNLARYDGVRYGVRREGENFWESYALSRTKGLGEEVKRRIMLGTYALSAGYYDAYYLKASKVRTLIKEDFEKAFEEVDFIASPTSPTIAFKLGEKQDPLAMYLADINTVPANLAGICGVSLPCGESGGLPVGFQLLGPQKSDYALLDVASKVEDCLSAS